MNQPIVIRATPSIGIALAVIVLLGWLVIAIGLLTNQIVQPVFVAISTLLFVGLAIAFISKGVRDLRYPDLLRAEQDSLSIRHSFKGSRWITFHRSRIASFETEETVDGKGLIVVFKTEATDPDYQQGCWSWVKQNRACCWFGNSKDDLGAAEQRLNRWLVEGDDSR